jgi:hypothetical protein
VAETTLDPGKLTFLLGRVPEADELDPDELGEDLPLLLVEDRPELGTAMSVRALRIAVAARILGDDPTGTWPDIQARLATGADRHAVMDQLTAEFAPLIDQATDIYLEIVRRRVHVPGTEAEAEIAERLALAESDPLARTVAAEAWERLLDDPETQVVAAPGDVLVHLPALLSGTVLTHHVGASELDDEHLDLEPDLAPLAGLAAHVADGPLHVDEGEPRWGGPAGWLAQVRAGQLLAVRIGPDAAVELTVLDDEPDAAPELVAAVRAAYDEQHAELGLPVAAEDLLVALVVADREAFAQPRPPLAELAAAAGLERRGHEYAHDPSVWAEADAFDRITRIVLRLGEEQGEVAVDVLDMLTGDESGDPAVLRRALEQLDDAMVTLVVADELLHPDDGSMIDEARALAARLVTAAGTSQRAASAHLVASVVEEHAGRPVDAESHLRAAAHSAEWAAVDDRLAWYASDRGDALQALSLWTTAGEPATSTPVLVMAPAIQAGTGVAPGRNDPCWCGSGRKSKQCHRDQPPLAPLRDRLGWLEYKPVSYVIRRGGAAAQDLADYADVLAGLDEDVLEVASDPLLLDVVLHEGGWFGRFLADRGELLPADERGLAQQWLGCERSVYEVTGIAYGKGVRVRDLRGGDEVAVTDARKVGAGELLCARIAPDGGDGHLFLGEVMAVPRGLEGEIRDLIDHGDPLQLLDALADLEGLEP